jgi:O-antigen ligase
LITILIQQSEGWSQAILLGGFLDPIWLARGLGVFTISLVVLAQITKAPIAKVCMWAVVAVLIFLMFYTGSRGPVFSLLITLLLYFAFLSRRPLWQGILLAFIGGVGLYAIFSAVPFGAQSRFLYFADPTAAAYVDTGARLQFWQRAVGIFRLSPVIGVGTGGYSYHAWGLDIRSYPHNLFLEIACELGILGIASFLAFLFAGIRVAGRISPGSTGVNRQNFPAIWGISIFIFALLNSMVSGDIFSNSLLWLSSGFMWATYVTFEKKKRNLNPENS